MLDKTTATEIAAKARFEALAEAAKAEGAPTPKWEGVHPLEKAIIRELVRPLVTALSEAGLLKEDQS